MTHSESQPAGGHCPSETASMPPGGDAYGSFAGLGHRRLYHVAWRILHNREESEDAVQEAHLRALTHLDQFSGRGPLGSWVQQITTREALTRLRRRVPSADLDDLHLACNGRTPEQEAAGGQLLGLILAAVQGLPAKYRTVFLLHECSGVDQRSAAASLGLNLQCVKTRLHRAKALLRDRLRPHLESPSSRGKQLPEWKRIQTLPGFSASQWESGEEGGKGRASSRC